MPPPNDSETVAQVISLKRAGHTWREIGETCGMTRTRARAIYLHNSAKPEYQTAAAPEDSTNLEPACTVDGVGPGDYEPDEEDVYRRALEQWQGRAQLEQRRRDQRISFAHGPAALVFVGDQHLGNSGTDIARLFAEAEAIASITGARVVLMGDLVDNFILDKMHRLRLETRFSIPDEWALLRRYLRILAPRLVAVVAGNHDLWTKHLGGFDYFREVVDLLAPGVIYATYDARILLQVGATEFPGRIRHHWRGQSIYNPTHGIERAALFDHDFVWGVGAHTHRCGVARGFALDGASGLAVLVGSYKRHDDYAEAGGFPTHNDATAIGVAFDESGGMVGFESLDLLRRFMVALYQPA